MFVLRRPSEARLRAHVQTCRARELNVPGLGIEWLDAPPPDFVLDRYGGVLGRGEPCYQAAIAAVRGFAMYPPGWTWVHAQDDPLALGSVYVSVIHHLGLYALLPGRVIELVDDSGAHPRFGFAFATLDGHLERGVERFTVSWSKHSDEVRFDALAVSQPGPLIRVVAGIARRAQLRFHAQSPVSMRARVDALLR